MAADNNSKLANPKLQANSSSSIPGDFQLPEIHLTPRSRRPLSHSDVCQWQTMQGNTSGSFGLTSTFFGRSNESGFFSDSPGDSSLSLHQIDELTGAGYEYGYGVAEQHEIDHFNAHELSALFNDIAEELGGCWKEIGRYLLRKTCSVENIDEDYSKVSEKAFQVLKKWREEKGNNACVTVLFKCFNHIGREDKAEKVLLYLPRRIANACERILLLSPKKIRSPSMITNIFNIKETFNELTVRKQLRIVGDDGEEQFEVYLCVSKINGNKYILKEIECGKNSFLIAARLAIPEKQFVAKKRKLRSTMDLIYDIRIKEETVESLKEILEQLQSKLKRDTFSFCKEDLNCTNCEKTKIKLKLLEDELRLLHHTLDKMSSGYKKLSDDGIPRERIHYLADRTYAVCEDHKKMHTEITRIKRRCSIEMLDVEEEQAEDEENSDEDNLTECSFNILQRFTRKRNVVQSLTPKRRKESKGVQRNKSDRSESRSRFFVPVRNSLMYKRGSKVKGVTRTDSKKTKRPDKNKDSKGMTKKKDCTKKPDLHSLHPRANTSSSALVCKYGSNVDVAGPAHLDLDELDDADSLSFRLQGTKKGGQTHPVQTTPTVPSMHRKVSKCNSDPYVRKDNYGEGVLDIITQEYYNKVKRSNSDGQRRKLNRDQIVKQQRQFSKAHQRRDQTLRKIESDFIKDSQKKCKQSEKRNDSLGVLPSDKSCQTRNQLPRKKKADAVERSQNGKIMKPENPDKSQQDSLQVSPSNKTIQDQDNCQTTSRMPLADLGSVSDEVHPEEAKSSESLQWLKDVDTENIIFV